MLLNGYQQGIGQAAFSSLDHRYDGPGAGHDGLVSHAGQELDKIDRFRWGILAEHIAVASAQGVV